MPKLAHSTASKKLTQQNSCRGDLGTSTSIASITPMELAPTVEGGLSYGGFVVSLHSCCAVVRDHAPVYASSIATTSTVCKHSRIRRTNDACLDEYVNTDNQVFHIIGTTVRTQKTACKEMRYRVITPRHYVGGGGGSYVKTVGITPQRLFHGAHVRVN